MAAIRGKDTSPEMKVRKLLHALGYRFRLHRRDLPGNPDIVLRSSLAIILVHGCFWHQHTCRDGRMPSSKREYWGPKLARNVERDKDNIRKLRRMGWRVLVIWECQIADVLSLTKRISRFLEKSAKSQKMRAH
jgi:DNA mismatch endonuclease (patch repair protein)